MSRQNTVVRSSSNRTSESRRVDISPSTAIGGSVVVSESALPDGASTSAAQATLLTELQLKADLTETQPVSAATLPLPSGAATAAKQDTLLTELQLKADLTETQPVSAASLPTPGLSIPPHDYILNTYTGADLTGVVYKTGGSGGTTVATLTLAYTAGVLISVTKS